MGVFVGMVYKSMHGSGPQRFPIHPSIHPPFITHNPTGVCHRPDLPAADLLLRGAGAALPQQHRAHGCVRFVDRARELTF